MSNLSDRSKKIRKDAIDLMYKNGGTHFGGSFSCTEILLALYDNILTEDDIFILSKGHSCWCYYAILIELGLNPSIDCHPHRDIANHIYCTTGSMGHGFPYSVGISLARKISNKTGKIYVLVGDGECQEGTTWESMLIASAKFLNNIVVIVDNNKIQGSDFTKAILDMSQLPNIARSIGWMTEIIEDGHDIEKLTNALKNDNEKPYMIIANTIKGKGISFMENDPKWHSKPLSYDLMIQAYKELQ